MPFTVTDFHDLVRLLEEHSDWRTELRRVLLSQDLLDLPRAVQEFAVAQRRTEEAITHFTERMERGFTEVASEWQGLCQDLSQLGARVERGFGEARCTGVAIVQDGTIDQESWEAALVRL
jgi:hypothetical protein